MSKKIIVALVAFIVSIALTEGMSVFFSLFIGVWLSTFIE